ncbi:class I SAM-dependent methyltransferase [Shewanella fidelis]|uniref:Class I SAM-dependent methyltransferase n=1 Tax=Shewanella fidelis TaxID=173509 RepID=A0AAW8NL47_9GAMM|nr:class I SAM-dependent methyltransferase [Shewanella fidelis]MDR8523422.1 class I SAM-dependent methyltransferase [Shewanella fidelis]MDW4813344.1 class I SAM-dependent methyltransferase [Shewanella fidelis]MDW4817284.1 class I SAM-dependent methyltransferase [Shewanella fidelis]MDW4821359.1 class I SAM-dependent methyltransferase [Shewanella fidelis]MDW4824563.1 class I SAM-dependent methyltransferase [Shewanella fidelis]
MPFYRSPRTISAFDAKFEAQKIAFAPISFQVARCLLKFNLLKLISDSGSQGCDIAYLAKHAELSEYAVGVLVDMGLSMGLLYLNNDKYTLDKIGHFLLHDDMAQVNLNFTHDVCYQGLFELEASLLEGKPKGLSSLGEWQTIYPGLSQLPEQIKKSWFEFDHYYSDHAFESLLPLIFQAQPKHIVDVGGNTGKWALACTNYDLNVHVTIMDLPGQLNLAMENAANAGVAQRVHPFATDLLDEQKPFCEQGDLYWMSQFLDCFSEDEILSILKRAAAVMKPDSELCILETFWDRQPFEAGAFCVNATSLYFTAIANGNSRMYHSKTLLKLISQAGLYVDEDIDNIGLGHTLLRCKRKP